MKSRTLLSLISIVVTTILTISANLAAITAGGAHNASQTQFQYAHIYSELREFRSQRAQQGAEYISPETTNAVFFDELYRSHDPPTPILYRLKRLTLVLY